MNKVILIGNLTKDVDSGTTGSGIAYCKFTVAIARKFKNANGEKETDFFNVVAWRATAELCGQYLHKGSKVGIAGSLQTRTYEQDSVKKYTTDIIAEEVEFLTPKSEERQEPKREKVKAEQMSAFEDELPF